MPWIIHGMSTIESALETLRSLSPDEIRHRLEEIAAEEKILRRLLRTRLDAEPRRQSAKGQEAAR